MQQKHLCQVVEHPFTLIESSNYYRYIDMKVNVGSVWIESQPIECLKVGNL